MTALSVSPRRPSRHQNINFYNPVTYYITPPAACTHISPGYVGIYGPLYVTQIYAKLETVIVDGRETSNHVELDPCHAEVGGKTMVKNQTIK